MEFAHLNNYLPKKRVFFFFFTKPAALRLVISSRLRAFSVSVGVRGRCEFLCEALTVRSKSLRRRREDEGGVEVGGWWWWG